MLGTRHEEFGSELARHPSQEVTEAAAGMNIATGTFGPFDVCTIREIVNRLEQYEDMDQIYVKDVKRLEPETPAVVRSGAISLEELEKNMGFRYLAEVDSAREAVEYFGAYKDDRQLRELLNMIDEYGE